MNFLMSNNIQRYHDLYNKFYIGYIEVKDIREELKFDDKYSDEQRVVIAIEKKYTDEIVLTYYIQLTRKNLYLFSYEDGKIVKEKKDPFGITVTEVYHINKMMDDSYILNNSNIKMVKKLLKERYLRNN